MVSAIAEASVTAPLRPAALSVAADLAGSGVSAFAAAGVDGEPRPSSRKSPYIMRPLPAGPSVCAERLGFVCVVVGGGLLPLFWVNM
jgi:hypothetical protein